MIHILFITSFTVVVLLSNTNNLFVIYANKTAQNHDIALLTTSSIFNNRAKIKYEKSLQSLSLRQKLNNL